MSYNLFISHSWTYEQQYNNLVDLLDQSNLDYKNFSVPKDDPIHTNGTNVELRSAITEKIRNCHVVLVLAGVYSTYSKWINIEIEVAKKSFNWKKPVIAIEPWGSERTSQHVRGNADEIVGWNTNSIVSAIKRLK
jgi:hypothetical protein